MVICAGIYLYWQIDTKCVGIKCGTVENCILITIEKTKFELRRGKLTHLMCDVCL